VSKTAPRLGAFAGYGIELEYMLVDRRTLSACPLADQLLRQGETWQADVERGAMGWSNELALHVVEVKNLRPLPTLEGLLAPFAGEIAALDARLAALDARLMPTAMHPWFVPQREARLWSHDGADLYERYDRVFDCRRHGWANLQSMHINLPFADDDEFARLHAAIRLVLPILPALAASSPIVEGHPTGWLDYRMKVYRTHQSRVAATIGEVIPDSVDSIAAYENDILTPMYRAIAPLDPDGVLQHEWLNARGAIPRFERNAIEIRVIDVQECPQADLAIAAAAVAVIRRLYDTVPLAAQQAIGTPALARILAACSRAADAAVLEDVGYLRLLGWADGVCTAQALWRFLLQELAETETPPSPWQAPLALILREGPLARRILRRLGDDFRHSRLVDVYAELCGCLEVGRLFVP
jgi:glutamate---cysteine ligase / carboxylate-amine ligase